MKNALNLITLVVSFLLFHSMHAQEWQEQAFGLLPSNYGVFDISIVDENIVWAVAIDQDAGPGVPLNHITKVLKTLDGGITWESIDIEETEGTISFDIEAFDSSTAFITTQDLNNGNGRGVFKTEDGGDTWAEKFNGLAGGVWIRFFNSQEGVIINRLAMATTQDGGESWQIVPTGNIPSFQNDEITILSSGSNSCQVIGNHVWFGTTHGRIYRSTDKGHTWEAFNTSLGSNALISTLAFRDTLNGIAADVNDTGVQFGITNDGGESWSMIISSPELLIANMEYVPATPSVLIGTSDIFYPISGSVSAYSTDFGHTWETINTGIQFGSTEFISPTIGWTSRGIITSPEDPAMYKWQGDTFVRASEPGPNSEIEVFPNPTRDHLYIASEKILSEYRLSTIKGDLIQSMKINSNESSIDFQSLLPGMYVLEFIFNDASRLTRKIFKVQ